MALTEHEALLAPMFDRAMELRDQGQLDDAIKLLDELVERLGPDDKHLSAHSHIQVGHIRKKQGRLNDSERHFREAVTGAPALELASLGLFHALDNLGRHVEAMAEMVRFLSLRESLGYRELLSDAAFGEDIPDDERRLVDAARVLLARHRERQQARSEPTVGDTIRVRSDAPEVARPGALASVRRQRTIETREEALIAGAPVGTTLFHLEFSDGESVDLPRSLLDHSDI